MGIIDGVVNVVTFGGHNRLQNAKTDYQQSYDNYQQRFNQAEALRKQIIDQYTLLGEITQASFSIVEKAYRILGRAEKDRLVWRRNQPDLKQPVFTKQAVQEVLLNYSSVKNLASGAGLGSAFTVGSWALVSLLGTASTGTAIATLSGAAAFNATLAWFGGGALAVGGAGMAGGSLVLGGFLAIPVLAYATWSSHSQASKIEEETTKINNAKVEIEQSIPSLKEMYYAAFYQTQQLSIASRALSDEYRKAIELLFPIIIISVIFRTLRGTMGRGYFLLSEAWILSSLRRHVDNFVSRFYGIYNIVCLQGVHEGKSFHIAAPDNFIKVGRHAENTIALINDAKASRDHAIIRFHKGDLVIEDCDSTNGTFVNDDRINGVQALQLDDKILVGDSCFYVAMG